MSIDSTQGQPKADSPFATLVPQQFLLLTTFRKNGVAMPTPIWFAHEDGKIVFMTVANTGKVKRIRNNGRVTLTPCDRAGKIIGDGTQIEGVAHELPTSEHAQALALLAQKYGLLHKLFTLFMNVRKAQRTYIEIVPAS